MNLLLATTAASLGWHASSQRRQIEDRFTAQQPHTWNSLSFSTDYKSQSMGSMDISQTSTRRQRLVPGSVSCRTHSPSRRSIQYNCPASDSRTSYALVRKRLLNATSILCANAGLSMTKPISVLSVDERGSKLNEPMKTRELSTVNAFACSLEPELPSRPALFLGAVSGHRRRNS